MDDQPEELRRAADRAARREKSTAEREGYASTDAGHAIARKSLPEFTEKLKDALRDARKDRQINREFLSVVRDLKSVERLAVCILHGALDSIGRDESYDHTAHAIGTNIYTECLRDDVFKHYGKKEATRIRKFIRSPIIQKQHRTPYQIVQPVEEAIRKALDHTKSKTLSDKAEEAPTKPTDQAPIPKRLVKAVAEADKKRYKTADWDDERLLQAGNWAINQLVILLPKVFARDDDSGQVKRLTLTPDAVADAEDFIAHLIERNPVWLPTAEAPRPWTKWNEGGTSDTVLQKSFHVVSSWHEQTNAAVKTAIRKGHMEPALRALNALQRVPYAINQPMLAVIKQCVALKIELKGLPKAKIPSPPRPVYMEGAKEQAWLEKRREVRRHNRRVDADAVQLGADIATASLMAEHGRFYTAMYMDWRGRVYGKPQFNFQRGDLVRSLFLFADGEPIGEDGIKWLKVWVANCGDFNKISKTPFAERRAWVDAHWDKIEKAVEDPLSDTWWHGADKPFSFLAACMELVKALRVGATYESHLPVSFDGSCSGLQHMCAMSLAPEGALVNLTHSAAPQDIYQIVADRTRKLIREDTSVDDADYRQMWLAYDNAHGIDRSTVKDNVMTYGYSITQDGMAKQQRKALIKTLDNAALLADKPRPFGDKWEQQAAASKYFVKQVYSAVEDTVKGPAKVRVFLRDLANALSNADKALRWTTPVGLPWINRYYVPRKKQIKLWLHNSPPYVTERVVGNKPEIAKRKASRSVAPNFVHSCDAAHLMLTVNAAVAEEITSIATVHDCFACLPSRAERFRHIIVEQFVRMYQENDVLTQVLEWARADLGDKAELPAVPKKGSLKIEDVLKAEYAFA